jgi:hypothetical protein
MENLSSSNQYFEAQQSGAISDLKKEIKNQTITALVGAGFSKLSANKDICLWKGLLEDGFKYLTTKSTNVKVDEKLVTAVQLLFDINELITVGGLIRDYLSSNNLLADWLEASIGSLVCAD